MHNISIEHAIKYNAMATNNVPVHVKLPHKQYHNNNITIENSVSTYMAYVLYGYSSILNTVGSRDIHSHSP